MSGNVSEWTCSWYTGGYGGTNNYEKCTGNSSLRVNWGGGWHNSAAGVRSADRYARAPGFRNYDLGFRLARTCP